jgi:hypothetical protein
MTERAALTGYFGAIDADERRARITLLEILGVSPTIDAAYAAYAAQTERFADSVQAIAVSSFETSTLTKPQLHIIAQGIIGAITTIAMQWLLGHRRRPRTQLIEATHVLVSAVLDRLSNATK